MPTNNFNPQSGLFLRFYARCFVYPYEEMGYELQHLFRQLEVGEMNEVQFTHMDQILNIINQYQGEDIKMLRENFVLLFSRWEGGTPLCPMIATNLMKSFGKRYDPGTFIDRLLDSGIPVDEEDPLDSIVNYLEYFSVLCEWNSGEAETKELRNFYKKHIAAWIPLFCDVLYKSGNVSFYQEVAVGLRNFLFLFDE